MLSRSPRATRRAACCALLLGLARLASGQQCKSLVKEIDFDSAKASGPYTEALAVKDWAPYSYLDGFWGDKSTKGASNERAELLLIGQKSVLQVKLPKGCVGTECGLQAKGLLSKSLEEATLQYMVRFGPNFDWVRGGKLPGLCGGACTSSCKEMSGLDGWSVSSMWRPCQWPPAPASKALPCEGGKLAAYVYHMDKKHWCGDDFDFTNKHSTTLPGGVPISFFQPDASRWYTITTYIKMNSAGSPAGASRFEKDGVLRVWVDGKQLVDKTDLAFRKFNNVSIDTLSMNSFFGGSSDSFRARKDETLQFDGFMVWEGNCPPRVGQYDDTVDAVVAQWPTMKKVANAASPLKASFRMENLFMSGGCAAIVLKNTGDRDCLGWVVEIHTRPSWGVVKKFHGLEMLSDDSAAGWIQLAPRSQQLQVVKAGATTDYVGFCATTHLSAMYLESQFHENIVVSAYCSKPGPKSAVAPSAAPRPDASGAASGECAGSYLGPSYSAKLWKGKVCLDVTLTYDGQDTCDAFELDFDADPSVIDARTLYASRVTIRHVDAAAGRAALASPAKFPGLKCKDTWKTNICMNTVSHDTVLEDSDIDEVVRTLASKCTKTSKS